MPTISLNGETIFFSRRGHQHERHILFVHGAGGTHNIWGHQVANLRGVGALALDLPGHGRSTGDGRATIPDYVEVIRRFLDALRLKRVVLAGHSMGGAIAQMLALTHPDRLAGLVLVGTGARLRVTPAILEVVQSDFQGAVRTLVRYAYGPDASPELVDQGTREWMANRPEVLHGDFTACDRFDIMTRLGEITCPTLIITGTEDRLTPPKYATYLRDHIPGAELVLVERAGHMVMVEKPEAVTAAIQTFLDARR
jgi:pimeloyl-ACP methyl ester carboxylesterase